MSRSKPGTWFAAFVVLTAFAVAGCSKTKTANEGDCEAAAAGFVASTPNMLEPDRSKGAEIVRKACKAHRWSSEVTTCMAKARTVDATGRCYQMLTPEQQQAFGEADKL